MLLFVDFDGVICDSARECMYSSWIAYHWRYTARQPTSAPADLYRRFLILRPYIRGGADYLTIQQALHTDAARSIRDQDTFDAYADDLGRDVIEAFDGELDAVRTELLAEKRELWLALNALFPFMRVALQEWRHDSRIYVLSTKRSAYISAILGHHGVEFPAERILYAPAATTTKLATIGAILNERPGETARLLDDQLDHLHPNDDRRIETFLATWGYVRPGFRRLADGPVPLEGDRVAELAA